MTLPSESVLDDLKKTIPWAFEQLMKNVWTSMPGIVEEYDAATRRALVRPCIEACLDDGLTVPRRAIADVPVIAPSCGGVTVTYCLSAGDAVWLSFSMRGIAAFKAEFLDAPATLTSFFSATDAVCFPGFGPPPTEADFAPSSAESHGFSSGVSLQSVDGAVHVSVSPEAVRVRAGEDAEVNVLEGEVCLELGDSVSVRLTSSGIVLDAASIDLTGFNAGWPKRIEDRLSAGGL